MFLVAPANEVNSLPPEMLAFIEVELPNPRAVSKIRNYVQKWRPMRLALPFGELDALGVARGPKFDKIIEQLFEMQLRGKARSPEDRTKALRSLAGIKEEPKKKEEKEKKPKAKGKEPVAAAKPGDGKDAKTAGKVAGQSTPESQQAAAKADAAAAHRAAHKHALAAHAKAKPPAAKKARGR